MLKHALGKFVFGAKYFCDKSMFSSSLHLLAQIELCQMVVTKINGPELLLGVANLIKLNEIEPKLNCAKWNSSKLEASAGAPNQALFRKP